MTAVHLVVPNGIDDATRPSGGNAYDRRVRAGLDGRDWCVRTHVVPGSWPTPDESSRAALGVLLAGQADCSVVVVDGLIGSAAGDVLDDHAHRLRIVALVHLPLAAELDTTDVARREHLALRAATAVVATSEWTRDWLIDRYGLDRRGTYVAEPGVDAFPIARGSSSGGRLLCVGALSRHKGQDLLVDALAALADREWRCRIVGPTVDADFADDLVRRISTSNVRGGHAGGDPARCWSRRVELTGPMSEVELAAVYAHSDVLVVPSRLETFGMVVSEAIAHGVPVIASDVGGLPRTVGFAPNGVRPGVLVRPGDSDALATALAQWLDDEVLRQRLRVAARGRRTSLRPWTDTVEQIASIVTQVAA